jgi:hypothetical protein
MRKIKRIDLIVVPSRGKSVTVSIDADKTGPQWSVFAGLGNLVLASEQAKSKRIRVKFPKP